jgi:L-lactate dehydrogenase complex protein LldG
VTAREDILARIHAALPEVAGNVAASHASISRLYKRAGALDASARLELFIDRLLDYDTEIIQIEGESELPSAIMQALQQAGHQRLLAAPEFPAARLPVGLSVELDRGLSTAEIDRAEAVLTTCEVAIASTGTIILVHGGAQGRRVITLLPDHHICLVRRDQVVELVPEALRVIASQSSLPITTISGPSATSDIEMTRIRGVHGPRRLTVILYGRQETAGPSK